MSENVAILGASDNPGRYSYKAYKKLTEHGHKAFLVSPKLETIEGNKVYKNLGEITEDIDTLTMYVSPQISDNLVDEILSLNPKRVIFNPGTENHNLVNALDDKGISHEEACTLVLLSTGQY